MRACIEKIRKPSAATDLCAEILTLAKEASQPSGTDEK
jgi:hypothetical protein